ncbi:hypothetical protein [Peribacillus frigoritolerans]|uniref:hypothetical protein n=1 Tax=Peribacillus frigoritolerans TaxID=450367 RepID=UPI000A82E173
MEEICDTPAEILSSRDPTGAYAEEAWQAVGGKGADFWNQLERFLKKLQTNSDFSGV